MLDDLLMELDGIEDEAAELGYTVPYRKAIKAAEEIIEDCYEIYPAQYIISPSPYGEVVIDIDDKDSEWFFWITIDSAGFVKLDIGGYEREYIILEYDGHDKVGDLLKAYIEEINGNANRTD